MRSSRAAPGKSPLAISNRDPEAPWLHLGLKDILRNMGNVNCNAAIPTLLTHRKCQKLDIYNTLIFYNLFQKLPIVNMICMEK